MFFTEKKTSDGILQQYCDTKSTENCLRHTLMKGLESSCVLRQNTECCCGGKVPYPKLDLVTQGRRCYRRRHPKVLVVSSELRKRLELWLKEELAIVMADLPHVKVLGPQYTCCDATMEKICSRADSIISVHDLDNVSLLRPELKSRFYDVISDILGGAPPAKKQRWRFFVLYV